MSEEAQPRSMTTNEFDKVRIYSDRMIVLLERDGTIEQFRGSTDYLIRTAIEALGLSLLFYDAGNALDWKRATAHLAEAKARCVTLRSIPGIDRLLQYITYSLEVRLISGERSKRLYDEIMHL